MIEPCGVENLGSFTHPLGTNNFKLFLSTPYHTFSTSYISYIFIHIYICIFMPTAILAEAYCFYHVLKNLECFEKIFSMIFMLPILHRTQIYQPQKFCLYLSLSLSIYICHRPHLTKICKSFLSQFLKKSYLP